MSIMRSVLLAGAESTWLRTRAVRMPFVRRSVTRFMPGEGMDSALEAARVQEAERKTGTILTHLGENLSSLSEADSVTRHYLELMQRLHAIGLNAQVSVKLTQLGLDLGADACLRNTASLLDAADKLGSFVWIDMESSGYVDSTLDVYRQLRERSARTGVCLQAYLRRTVADLEALLPLAPAIRLVKGAYREPAEVAFQRKREVDQNYYLLASRLLDPARIPGTFLGIATHDERLIRRLRVTAAAGGTSTSTYEFEMLYGIARPLQAKLTRAGARLRVLISYGEYWFPWYMRRLAERPANVLFVVRNLFG